MHGTTFANSWKWKYINKNNQSDKQTNRTLVHALLWKKSSSTPSLNRIIQKIKEIILGGRWKSESAHHQISVRYKFDCFFKLEKSIVGSKMWNLHNIYIAVHLGLDQRSWRCTHRGQMKWNTLELCSFFCILICICICICGNSVVYRNHKVCDG